MYSFVAFEKQSEKWFSLTARMTEKAKLDRVLLQMAEKGFTVAERTDDLSEDQASNLKATRTDEYAARGWTKFTREPC